ncbi:MAG TPA: hypothetical protein VMU95_29615 [Trebonia sp.]|nr:hypothetical protein [Trebonia sp.]
MVGQEGPSGATVKTMRAPYTASALLDVVNGTSEADKEVKGLFKLGDYVSDVSDLGGDISKLAGS